MPAPTAFDAAILLDRRNLPPGTDPDAAAEAVRRAVSGLSGARTVAVSHAAARQPGDDWLRLSTEPDGLSGAVLAALRASLRAAAAAAVTALAPSPGFAEAGGAFAAFARRDAPESSAASERGATPDGPLEILPDVSLLSTLLSRVQPGDAAALAGRAVARFGSFAAVLAASPRELREVRGLGQHSVAALKLVHEAALRLSRAGVMHRPVLDEWSALIAYLTTVLARERVEQFRVLFLDGEDRLLADEAQARGTVNHTPVYPREVVKRALELGAAAVILVHNHPSGDPTPSREDIEMTIAVREAAEVLSVELRDHVIVGNGRWTSFRSDGLL